jgi:hypothetical protein
LRLTHYAYYYRPILGRIMLGYTEQDIRKMIASCSMFLNTEDKDIQGGLSMTIDFLQGLLEEGHFE